MQALECIRFKVGKTMTVTIYEFNAAEELVKLDVYVMPLEKRS